MNKLKCSKNQLSQLLNEKLDANDSERVINHVEQCANCQRELESIAADEFWWKRAKQNLTDLPTDQSGRLIEPELSRCSIDTLLDFDLESSREESPQAVMGLLTPAKHPEMLGRLDEFDIEAKIGQGGMGIVFRGFDRSLNRPVAIKVMAPHLSANGIARQRFEREAKAAAAVVHPNVVPIYRVSTALEHRSYIAMALADGLSLQEHVALHGPFDVKDVVRIGIQIAGGLAEAHKHGLIHRDIKPANVLFEKDVCRILITDFGLARAADEIMMTQSGCLAGTPSYMSPEQVVGNKVDARSDLFSLGSLLYFIATGREPFEAESAFAVINKVAHENPRPARSINIDIPELLNRIIERLMEKDPRNRIESAEELQHVLTQFSACLQEPTQYELPFVKATSLARRRKRIWIGIGVVLAGIALVGILRWNGFFIPTKSGPVPEHTEPGHDQHRHSEDVEHGHEHR